MKKRVWTKGRKGASLLLSVSLLAVFAAACGGNTPQQADGQTGASGGETPKEPSKEPVTLVFYSNNGGTVEAFDQRFGDALRKKFPHYTIEYIRAEKGTMLPDLVAAGKKFDIFFASIGNYESALFEYKLEKDMTSLIASKQIDLNRFESSIIEAMKQISGGKMYGLPVFNNVMVTFYNKTIFDKFGVTYPKDGMTWDEAHALAKRLDKNEGGRQYVGLTVNPGKIISLNPFSIPALDTKTGKPTINSNDGWKKLFDTMFVKPLQDAGVREEMARQKKIPDHYSFVREHNLAMYVYSADLPAVLPAEMENVDWDMAAMPHYADQPRIGSQAYPSYFGITTLTQHPNEAMEAIQYLTSDEYQLDMSKSGNIPVLGKESIQKAYGTEAKYKDKRLSSVFYNKSAPIPLKSALDPAIANIYAKQAAAQMALTSIDMNTAFRVVEEEALKTIQQENSK
jgi:multiple sugar transport system substrate-binding protein